jgi:hypothetical protein
MLKRTTLSVLGKRISGVFEKATRIHARDVSELNRNQAYNGPQDSNATFRKGQDCKLKEHKAQHQQQSSDLEDRSCDSASQKMECDGVEQVFVLVRITLTLHTNCKRPLKTYKLPGAYFSHWWSTLRQRFRQTGWIQTRTAPARRRLLAGSGNRLRASYWPRHKFGPKPDDA